MGSYLITPIQVNGGYECADGTLRRTDGIETGSAIELDDNPYWGELFRVEEDTYVNTEGSIFIGFGCGVSEVTLRFCGVINGVQFNPQLVSVYHNAQATDLLENLWDAWSAAGGIAEEIETGPGTGYDDLTIDLSERPCGNVIEIRGICPPIQGYGYDVWWQMKINAITTDGLVFNSSINSQYLPLI